MNIEKEIYKDILAHSLSPIVVLAALKATQHAYAQMGAYTDEIQMFVQTLGNTAVRMVEQYSGLDD